MFTEVPSVADVVEKLPLAAEAVASALPDMPEEAAKFTDLLNSGGTPPDLDTPIEDAPSPFQLPPAIEPAAEPPAVDGLSAEGYPVSAEEAPTSPPKIPGDTPAAAEQAESLKPAVEAAPAAAEALPDVREERIRQLEARVASLESPDARAALDSVLKATKSGWEAAKLKLSPARAYEKVISGIEARIDKAVDGLIGKLDQAHESAVGAIRNVWAANETLSKGVEASTSRSEIRQFLETASASVPSTSPEAAVPAEVPAAAEAAPAAQPVEQLVPAAETAPAAEPAPESAEPQAVEGSLETAEPASRASAYLEAAKELKGEGGAKLRETMENWFKAASAIGVSSKFIEHSLAHYGAAQAEALLKLHANPDLQKNIETIDDLDGLDDEAKAIAIAEILEREEMPRQEDEEEEAAPDQENRERLPLKLEAESYSVMDPRMQANKFRREFMRLQGGSDASIHDKYSEREEHGKRRVEYAYSGEKTVGYLKQARAEQYRRMKLMDLFASSGGDGKSQVDSFKELIATPELQEEFGRVGVEVPEDGSITGWEKGVEIAIVSRRGDDGILVTELRLKRADNPGPEGEEWLSATMNLTK